MTEVRVNGVTYNLFKQLDISSSLDDFSSETRIIISENVNDSSFMKVNDLVEVYLDGIQKVSGYAENVEDNESNDSHDVSYRIRDKVADIIDSSIPDNVKSLKNVNSFSQLCKLVVNGLGSDIQVIDRVGATLTGELKAGEIGQESGDFLQGYARQVGVFLNTDGKGNILIRKPAGKLQTILLNAKNGNNNILNSNISLDWSKRFYKYIVRSNANVAAEGKTDNLNVLGVAFDNDVRKTRIFEKVSETPMTAEQCKNAAIEEANVRRLRSFNYRCSVVGWSANGELWEEGKSVTVKDEYKGVIGVFVIKDVQYNYSDNGEITTMNLTYNDAYTNDAELNPVSKRISKNASTYTIESGDTLSGIAAKNNLTISELISINPQIQNPDRIQEGQLINIPVTGGN